jgi:glyoxylase-like metal-dependent hydrolase (beta-lactamase superfamily II)
MKIIEHVYHIPGVMANPYLIVDADGLTLIDAGLPRSEKKILAYIASLGKAPGDVKRIIITHGDMDHVGSLAALKQATGARTYASKIESEFIAAGKSPRESKPSGFSLQRMFIALMKPFFKATPFQVDEFLADGQVLPILGGLRVLDTSGHTPGHISLFAPEAGILFCGDSLVNDEQGIHGSRSGLTWDEAKAREAEKKQSALGARIVCSGHGPVITDAMSKFLI